MMLTSAITYRLVLKVHHQRGCTPEAGRMAIGYSLSLYWKGVNSQADGKA